MATKMVSRHKSNTRVELPPWCRLWTLHVEIEKPGYRPCRCLNQHKNRGQNLLLLPFAASLFCNIRHITRIWRKRVGVEFTPCQNRKELREDATSPKQREGIHRSAYCPRIAHEFPSRAFPLRQHHLNHPAIRFPQCFWNRLCVDVQGCPNISVTE